jgi:ferredoxin
MAVGLLGLLLAIAAGITGTAAGSANFGIVFVWIVWWGLLMGLLLPLGGRLWCLVCPVPAPGEWLQRKALVAPPLHGIEPSTVEAEAAAETGRRAGLGLARRWPKALRGIWLQNTAFLGTALFSALILTRPSVTGWVLLAFLAGAAGLALVFERRAFCRYVCPVGGFIGLYSLVSPVELRIRDPRVCQEHRTKDCYLGNAEGYGCPWMERPWSMDRNAYCGLCGECLRTCPKDNVRVNLRLPGHDLLVVEGWRMDEAYKAFIMLACAGIYPLIFLGPWGWPRDWANLSTAGGFVLFALAFLACNLVAVPGLHVAVVALTRQAAGLRQLPLRNLCVALAYPLVPLGLAAWVAFTLSFVLANLSYALPVLSDPFGWGWDLFGTRHLTWQPWLTGLVPPMQAAILVGGLVLAIWTAAGILRRFGEEATMVRGLVVQSVALLGQTVFFLWLYLGVS